MSAHVRLHRCAARRVIALTPVVACWYPVAIRTGEVRRRTVTGVPAGWWPDLLLLAGFAALTVALARGALLDLDVAVRDWCLAHHWEPLYLLARQLNHLGSANLLASICLVIAVASGIRARSATPVLPILVAYAMSYLLIGPIKLLTDRAAPRDEAADAVRLFADPSGLSYPSGHVVNTFIWFQVLVLLLLGWRQAGLAERTRRALRVAPPVIVSATVSYLAFHWLTDVVAGLLLGLLLDRLLRRVLRRLPRRLDAKISTQMDTCGSAS